MKNIISTLTAIVVLASCQSQQDKVVSYAKDQMKDPKSFELVKVAIRDTARLSDVMTEAHNMCDRDAASYYKEAGDHYNTASLFYTESLRREYKQKGDEAFKQGDFWLARRDSLKTEITKIQNTKKDTIVCVNYALTCYANNSLGERRMNQFIVHVYPNGLMDMEEYETEKEKDIKHEIETIQRKLSSL